MILPVTKSHFLFIVVALLFVIITFSSCKEPAKEEQTVMIDPATVQQGPVVHDSLSAAQLEKIRTIHQTFAEVQPGSLEETITDFEWDQDPDREINLWLNMAGAYNKFISMKGSKADWNTKKEAFRLVLLRSMMPPEEAVNEAQLIYLTVTDADSLMQYYDAPPQPVTVIQK